MAKSGEYAVAVKVHVSEDTAAKLKAIAAENDRSLNYILRRIIAEYLDRS